MLAGIRKFAQSWPARILMAILAISFVGWGASQSVNSGMVAPNQIIKAGSRKIDAIAFKRTYDNFKKRLEEQQNGQPITAEAAEANRLDRTVLEGLATQTAFSELLSRSGIRPSDKLILEQIEKIPAFFDQITGKFDRKTFEQALARNDLRPADFDAELRDQIAAQHWSVAVQNGLRAPRAYGALAAIYALEARDLTYMTLGIRDVPAPSSPTDAQLQAFVKENAQALTTPEARALSVVVFTPQAAAASAGPIDPAELKKRYDFRKDTLSTPETRTVVQIPAKTPAAAQQAAARLAKGDQPAVIARALGVDPVTYTNKPKTALPDRKVADAAFSGAAGQVSVVQGELGLSAIRIVSVNPGHGVTLEEARPMLEAEIRKDQAAEKVYAQSQAYDDARQTGADMAAAAAKAGVSVITVPPVTQQGQTLSPRPAPAVPPKVLELAYTLPAGGESEITELGDGGYFVVKVDRIEAPHIPPLAEIRPQLTQVWMQREVVKALEAKAESLNARIKKGESLEAVASSAGLPVSKLPSLSRQTAGAHPELGQEVLGRSFAAKPGESWIGRAPNGLVIGRIDNVRVDRGPAAGQLAESGRGQLTGVLFREMSDAAQAYARAKLKVKTNPELARATLGLAPLADKKGEKKK